MGYGLEYRVESVMIFLLHPLNDVQNKMRRNFIVYMSLMYYTSENNFGLFFLDYELIFFYKLKVTCAIAGKKF